MATLFFNIYGELVQRTLLKSKIERILVVDTDVAGEELLWLDRELMKKADLWPLERVEVYNVDNGARFSTVVAMGANLERPDTGGTRARISGAAAHLVQSGHLITIASYVVLDEAGLARYSPKIICADPLKELHR